MINNKIYIKKNMNLLCFICVVFLVTRTEGLYSGESCVVNNRPGRCRLLTKCYYLVNEIKEAGAPMPSHIRRKLLSLSCGFDNDQPLVCCDLNTQSTNNSPEHGTSFWSSLETGSEGQNEYGNDKPYTNEPINSVIIKGGEKNGDKAKDSIPDISNHPNLNLLPTNCGMIEGDRIFGGNRTRLFEMPWMVLLSYESSRGRKLSCGGTLITEWYVLTAAHCVSFLGSSLELRNVILGEYDVRTDPDCERIEGDLFCASKVRNVSVDEAIAHSGYSPQKLVDDIALIRLSEPADLSLDSIKPICLPTSRSLQSEPLEGLNGVVAGWGATEDGLQSPVLLSVDLPILTNKNCQEIYRGLPSIYDQQVCAGGVPDKDSCGGDSGGPLMYPGRTESVGVRYVQRGIVSYGAKRCGVGGLPGVYTRVAYYMKWILDNIRETKTKHPVRRFFSTNSIRDCTMLSNRSVITE